MHEFSLKAAIDRFEGTFAVIRTEDSQEIVWPIRNLPDNTAEGESIILLVSTSQNDTEERERIARAMLNEILKNR